MRRLLSLTLSFAVCLPGLVALSAAPARAQEFAAASSLDTLRREYEQMLAVERNAATPPEVRELNRTFLEERRAQLAAAIRHRVGALARYRAAVGATLSDAERRVIDDSVARLSAELRALLPEAVPPAAPAARRSRRPARAAAAPAVEAPDPVEAAAAAPEAPRRAAPIEITSPARARVVRTAEVEVEVGINDEEIDDLLVAIYTPASPKPVSARTVEVKRSDKGTKSVVVALARGENRVEVSDLRRGEIKAERTITYAPGADPAIGSAPAPAGDGEAARADGAAPARGPKAAGGTQAGEAGPTTAVVCGEVVPASINETFAMIKSTLSEDDYRSLKMASGVADYEADGSPKWDDLQSVFTDDCGLRTNRISTGTATTRSRNRRKRAVIKFLEAYLEIDSGNISSTLLRKLNQARTELIDRGVNDADDDTPNFTKLAPARRRGPNFPGLSRDSIKKQIMLLEQYTGNVMVHVVKDDGDIVRTMPADSDAAFPNDSTDADGNFRITVPLPEDGAAGAPKFYLVSTEGDTYHLRRKVVLRRGDRMKVDLEVEDRPVSLLARAVVGYDQAGASAATREQSYFFDLYLSKPLPFRQKIDPDFGERWRTWGDIRFNSAPQPGDSELGTFVANFAQQAAGVKVKDAARVFDFQAGLEVRLAGNNSLLPNFDRVTRQKFSLSFIASAGAITPLNPRETIATFKVFPDAPGLPPEAKGKEFVTFIASDRDHFFRQYYAGFRIQSFFFNRFNVPMQRFPAQLDFTIGQNEFVTGGRLRGPVFRIEGYYPLPYEDLKFVNLFGTAILRPGRSDNKLPLLLEAAPAGTTVPASNVALVLAPHPNRDYYRAGIGIDFISFVEALKKMGNK